MKTKIFGEETVEFDFTANNALVYGDYPQVELGDRFALWAGDTNADGRCIPSGPHNDILPIFFNAINAEGNEQNFPNHVLEGYFSTDIDLNGQSIFAGPNNERIIWVQNIIPWIPIIWDLDSCDNCFMILEFVP